MRASFPIIPGTLAAAALLAGCVAESPRPVVVTAPPAPPPSVIVQTPPPQNPVIVAPTPAYSGTSMAPIAMPNGAVRLGPADVVALLANNTAFGLSGDGTPYEIYFVSNGIARFRSRATLDTGTWRVMADGELCSRLPFAGNGVESCHILARAGDVILYVRPDGVATGSIRVVAGNPRAI